MYTLVQRLSMGGQLISIHDHRSHHPTNQHHTDSHPLSSQALTDNMNSSMNKLMICFKKYLNCIRFYQVFRCGGTDFLLDFINRKFHGLTFMLNVIRYILKWLDGVLLDDTLGLGLGLLQRVDWQAGRISWCDG